jgi:1-acyl-sn-glycerol-3-phosphate acyltransferase
LGFLRLSVAQQAVVKSSFVGAGLHLLLPVRAIAIKFVAQSYSILEFVNLVKISLTQDQYVTDVHTASPFCRLLPSFFYYSLMARIVLSAGRVARHGGYDNERWIEDSKQIVDALERVGVHFEVEGLNQLRATKGPWIVVGNHMSTLETFVLPWLLLPLSPVTFVVKRGLIEYPIFRHVMISRDPVVVERTNPREDFKTVMEEGKARLDAGRSVVVFPQTTRTPHFDPEDFNTIGVKLAKRAGVPIIPVALKTDAWSNGRLIKDLGPINPKKTVHFAFGPPLMVQGNGQAAQATLVSFIQSKLAEWGV